jgi:F-type H+-transporting ATPase subunit epsilon
MYLEIISPEKSVYAGETESVTLPGAVAPFMILKRHAPIISALTKGVITYRVNGKKTNVTINGGFVEAKNDHISVCIE